MKLAIMQPYFFPYIGYFQLMNHVDRFVIYDNIKYTRKGWINRNRILVNGKDEFLTLPLRKDSDFLSINERWLSDQFDEERQKMLRRIEAAYKKSKKFKQVFPLIEEILMFPDRNLFEFLRNSLLKTKEYIGIKTDFAISSSLAMDHGLKSQDRVMATCQAMQATVYVNPIGGVELYNKDDFKKNGIDLYFLKAENVQYPQLGGDFMPFLSIIDVLMFNDLEEVNLMLNKFTRQ